MLELPLWLVRQLDYLFILATVDVVRAITQEKAVH